MTQPLDPLTFLTLAQELARRDQKEATLRTAVNRAYYALFLIARDKTGVKGTRNIHMRVIQAVRRRRGYRSTGDQLDALRRLRTIADYQLLPADPAYRDWVRNWSRAQVLILRILPKLQAW